MISGLTCSSGTVHWDTSQEAWTLGQRSGEKNIPLHFRPHLLWSTLPSNYAARLRYGHVGLRQSPTEIHFFLPVPLAKNGCCYVHVFDNAARAGQDIPTDPLLQYKLTEVMTNRLVRLRPALVTGISSHCHHRFDLRCPGNNASYGHQLSDAVCLYLADGEWTGTILLLEVHFTMSKCGCKMS